MSTLRFLTLTVLASTVLIAPLYAQTSTESLNISVTVPSTSTAPAPSGGGGGGGGVTGGPADVIFKGFAYPGATVTFLRNGSVIGTALADTGGFFEKRITTTSGLATFGVWAKDALNLNSSTVNISINLSRYSETEISNLFLPPTITAGKKNISRGSTIEIFGSTFPGSIVRLFGNFSGSGPLTEVVSESVGGRWSYVLDTDGVSEGTYSFYAIAESPDFNLISSQSETITFTLQELRCSGADFNTDGRVNIVDFSILLFYWGGPPDQEDRVNSCVDLNNDEFVNLFDFSILMYEWTD